MASGRHDPHGAPTTASARLRRALGDPSLHGVLVAVGFLLALWPFARTPEGELAPVTAYLFALWAAFVVALVAISRGRAARDGNGSSDRA